MANESQFPEGTGWPAKLETSRHHPPCTQRTNVTVTTYRSGSHHGKSPPPRNSAWSVSLQHWKVPWAETPCFAHLYTASPTICNFLVVCRPTTDRACRPWTGACLEQTTNVSRHVENSSKTTRDQTKGAGWAVHACHALMFFRAFFLSVPSSYKNHSLNKSPEDWAGSHLQEFGVLTRFTLTKCPKVHRRLSRRRCPRPRQQEFWEGQAEKAYAAEVRRRPGTRRWTLSAPKNPSGWNHHL